MESTGASKQIETTTIHDSRIIGQTCFYSSDALWRNATIRSIDRMLPINFIRRFNSSSNNENVLRFLAKSTREETAKRQRWEKEYLPVAESTQTKENFAWCTFLRWFIIPFQWIERQFLSDLEIAQTFNSTHFLLLLLFSSLLSDFFD